VAIYTIKLTIPANTSKDAPVSTSVELARAVLVRFSLRIPPGHCALTGLRIKYGRMQLWPEEPDTWISGDDEALEWNEYFELPDDPTRLTLEGYNEDVAYEHSFYVRMMTLPKAIAYPWLAVSKFVKLLSRLVGLR